MIYKKEIINVNNNNNSIIINVVNLRVIIMIFIIIALRFTIDLQQWKKLLYCFSGWVTGVNPIDIVMSAALVAVLVNWDNY